MYALRPAATRSIRRGLSLASNSRISATASLASAASLSSLASAASRASSGRPRFASPSVSSRLGCTSARRLYSSGPMKALVYNAQGQVKLEERPRPALALPTDAIVRVTKTTICGTDLHICKGDVATCEPGRILGHEGVGVVESTGASVSRFQAGDRVLISCVSSCAACDYCRRGMYSHCSTGGWILGNTIDGTQAEYVRIPHADTSLYALPDGTDDTAAVLLSDIFPTGFECGVLNARVAPGATVAIVGAGPVGLAALITAQLYSPSLLISIDRDDNRLHVATAMGAHKTINNSGPEDDVVKAIMDLTDGKGCDSVIEAVGVSASFELCQRLLAPGGTLANMGVHGTSAPLHLDKLWDRNIAITTRLVDTITVPMLLRLTQAGRLDPTKLITHHYKFSDIEQAYETFGAAAKTSALKVMIEME